MKATDALTKFRDKLIEKIERFEATEYFEKIPDVIRARTRNGYGISEPGGEIVPLKDLANSTVIHRELLDRKGQLSDQTAPFFSNLTESGKMLDAMRFKRNGKRYIISFDDRRSRNGKKPSDIKDFVEEKGFVFFGLAKKEMDALNDNVKEKLRKEIDSIRT